MKWATGRYDLNVFRASFSWYYNSLYNQGAQPNAEVLSKECFAQADIAHIAEELVDLGKSNQREVQSFLIQLIMHLLKWQFQPAHRSASWTASIGDSRVQLELIFKQSPSLKRFSPQSVAEVYPYSRDLASGETGWPITAFPGECPYTFQQLVDPNRLYRRPTTRRVTVTTYVAVEFLPES